VDRGFIISDHCDWDGLTATIAASGADAIGVTHGYSAEMVRWLQEKGRAAEVIEMTAAAETPVDEEGA
jgi:putative mRNA 3-end processing factor